MIPLVPTRSGLDYGQRGLGDPMPLSKRQWEELPAPRTGGNGMIVNGNMIMRPFELAAYGRTYTPTDAGEQYQHPFKMYVVDDSGPKLRVNYGIVTRPVWYDNGSTASYITTETAIPTIGSGKLLNDPEGGTDGEISLSASTTYGVWIRGATNYQGPYYPPEGYVADWANHFIHSMATSCDVVVSSTRIGPADGVNFTSDDTTYGYVYIGKITLDSDGLATIQQYRRSDATLPFATFPDVIRSAENVDLTQGTLGGIGYEAP